MSMTALVAPHVAVSESKRSITHDDVAIGIRIRRIRRWRGMSQIELGARVGVRSQQVQKWECAANRVYAARLQQVADALEAPVWVFYDPEKLRLPLDPHSSLLIAVANGTNANSGRIWS